MTQFRNAVTKLLQEELQGDLKYCVYNGRIMIDTISGYQTVAHYDTAADMLTLAFYGPPAVRQFHLADPDCFAQAVQAVRERRSW